MSQLKLTAKQEKFSVELATGVDENNQPISQAEAYRRSFNAAKMTEKSIWEKASELANNVKVSERVKLLRDEVAKAAAIDASYVLKRLVEIDQMDVIDIHNDDGTIKPIREWPKVWRQYLTSIEVSEIMQGSGDDRQIAAILKKVKWPDKVRNLELIGKHLAVGAFVERVDHTSSDKSMSPKGFTADEYAAAQAKLKTELPDLD
jgi:phage terminase small subunit